MAWLINRTREIGAGGQVGGDDAADPSPAQLVVRRKTRYIRIEIDQAERIERARRGEGVR